MLYTLVHKYLRGIIKTTTLYTYVVEISKVNCCYFTKHLAMISESEAIFLERCSTEDNIVQWYRNQCLWRYTCSSKEIIVTFLFLLNILYWWLLNGEINIQHVAVLNIGKDASTIVWSSELQHPILKSEMYLRIFCW